MNNRQKPNKQLQNEREMRFLNATKLEIKRSGLHSLFANNGVFSQYTDFRSPVRAKPLCVHVVPHIYVAVLFSLDPAVLKACWFRLARVYVTLVSSAVQDILLS